MNRSRFLAGLIGPTLMAIAAGLVLNPGVVQEMAASVQDEYAFIFIVGIAAMTAGLAMVMSHNLWRGWPAVVTIIGWLTLLGGVARIVFPHQVLAFADAAADTGTPALPAIAAALFLLGLFLSWKAFLPSRTESV